MNKKPNYKFYTLDQLYDARKHIDREKYPDRLQEIESEIAGTLSNPRIKAELERQKAEAKYHTFWPRFWAGCIDGIIFYPLTFLDNWIWSNADVTSPIIILSWFLFYSLIFLAYSILMHGYLGQTIGKMVFKIKVLNITETKLELEKAVLRDIFPLITSVVFVLLYVPGVLNKVAPRAQYEANSTFAIVGSAGLIWFLLEIFTMLTNKKRRAIHDFIAGSVVTRF